MPTSAVHDAERPADVVGRRLAAERDALLELIAIFAHDLSNPLQSLTVLCELGVEECPPGSESQQRTQQCLDAAERMRALVHGLAGVIRRGDGLRTVGAMYERIASLLARRFDRHSMEVDVDLAPLAELEAPEHLELAVVNLLLGYFAAASESRSSRNALTIRGRPEGDGHAVLELEARSFDRSGAEAPLPPTPTHVSRVRDALGPDARVTLEGGSARIELALGAASGGAVR